MASETAGSNGDVLLGCIEPPHPVPFDKTRTGLSRSCWTTPFPGEGARVLCQYICNEPPYVGDVTGDVATRDDDAKPRKEKKGSREERLQRAQPPGRVGPGRYLGRNLEQFIRVAPDVMRGAEKGAATAGARTPMRAARAVRSEKGRQRNLIPPTGSLFTIDRTEGKITGPTKPPLRTGPACHRDVLIPSARV